MYTNFARRHIDATGGVSILHFAGYGYPDTIKILQNEREVQIHFDQPRSDLPSWTPDWRIFSRPVALDPSNSAAMPFAATTSTASYSFCGMQLRVLASKVDTVSICGMPYSPTLCDGQKTTAYEVFADWMNLVMKHFPSPAWESLFAFTLVMDGKVKLVDHRDLEISTDEILSLFGHWLARNLCHSDNPGFGLEESSRYGNVAEEVCRNRRFFLTETGRMGLGLARIHPNASVYLIHGLKTPVVVDDRSEGDLLYGECFVQGLMYGEDSISANISNTQPSSWLRSFSVFPQRYKTKTSGLPFLSPSGGRQSAHSASSGVALFVTRAAQSITRFIALSTIKHMAMPSVSSSVLSVLRIVVRVPGIAPGPIWYTCRHSATLSLSSSSGQ
ncbi:hypothetical protein LTR56_024053 [Elasticomyces elasticus]|nr:hypothetical protein LTR56_024053 [Elasticomyces elasticus]